MSHFSTSKGRHKKAPKPRKQMVMICAHWAHDYIDQDSTDPVFVCLDEEPEFVEYDISTRTSIVL